MSSLARGTSNSQLSAQWQAALGELKLQMPRATFDTWVKDTSVVQQENNEYVIGVPNAYAKDWLENRLSAMMKRALANVTGQSVELKFVVQQRDARPAAEFSEPPLLTTPATRETQQPAQKTAHYNERQRAPVLNPRYTFETFIVGSDNRLAHAVSLSVSERPGEAYNPLFLYGGVGLGKTHLLQAIAHALVRSGHRVLYVTSEVFTNDLIYSLRTQSTEAFREKYRTCDALLIDDIQFIADKERTQEEFFHTFNALHAANRQIVLSSDRPPRAIAFLEDRLRSRFEGGMMADIQPPDFETRVAILQARANAQSIPIPQEVLMLIAQRVQSNIRELDGTLTRILAETHHLRGPVSYAHAERILNDLAPERPRPTPNGILTFVANQFKIELEALTSTTRVKTVAWPRQLAMYLLREETELSLPDIGKLLGGRDHTTIMHGIEKVATQMARDEAVQKQVSEMRDQLHNTSPPR